MSINDAQLLYLNRIYDENILLPEIKKPKVLRGGAVSNSGSLLDINKKEIIACIKQYKLK